MLNYLTVDRPQKLKKESEKLISVLCYLHKDSGRVKVFVRVRPPRPQETSRKEPIAVNVQELSSQVRLKCSLIE